MVNRPHPPNPPDVGGARGGKIPAKNKEKWYNYFPIISCLIPRSQVEPEKKQVGCVRR
jgi:hypothetical protein